MALNVPAAEALSIAATGAVFAVLVMALDAPGRAAARLAEPYPLADAEARPRACARDGLVPATEALSIVATEAPTQGAVFAVLVMHINVL